jgi:post-segregation antitoxin (ccd killing protein)
MKRAEAKLLGLKTYNTGKPCKHGHLSNRYASTAICVECVKLQSTAWRIANPEKHSASMQKWIDGNRELHGTRVKRWQEANKDKVRADAKAWVKANPEKVKAKHLRHIKKHPDAYTARSVASVARRAKRVPQWLTSDDKWMMRQAYNLAKLRTQLFGFVWEVDHIIPLRGELVSGLHVPTNLQVIPKSENRSKKNHYLLA